MPADFGLVVDIPAQVDILPVHFLAGLDCRAPLDRVQALDQRRVDLELLDLVAVLPANPKLAATLPDDLTADWTKRDKGVSFVRRLGEAFDRTNVKNLRVAWSWSLPPGPNTATSLEHDGVLFVQGYGDQLEALDAATGDLLWQYRRTLPEDARPSVKKSIAVYGNNIYAATSDTHLIALDMKTGRLFWDTALEEGNL
jgi:alcohol dehydrogenase (cytochrome c)